MRIEGQYTSVAMWEWSVYQRPKLSQQDQLWKKRVCISSKGDIYNSFIPSTYSCSHGDRTLNLPIKFTFRKNSSKHANIFILELRCYCVVTQVWKVAQSFIMLKWVIDNKFDLILGQLMKHIYQVLL